MIDKILDVIGRIPSTNARISVTLLIWLGTAIWVWCGGEPPIEFLGTIVIMSGLDAAQFYGKRVTHSNGQS